MKSLNLEIFDIFRKLKGNETTLIVQNCQSYEKTVDKTFLQFTLSQQKVHHYFYVET